MPPMDAVKDADGDNGIVQAFRGCLERMNNSHDNYKVQQITIVGR